MLPKASWDPGRLTPTRRAAARDALPSGDNGARRWRSAVHPGDPAAGTREETRHTAHLGRVRTEHLVPELRGPGEGSELRPNRVCAFVESPRT